MLFLFLEASVCGLQGEGVLAVASVHRAASSGREEVITYEP